MLALNDHVLKGAWPGWLTGKLSDFAGLVVVATLASVLLGPARGTVVAGLGFAALKTVPWVAEAVAPLLGGVTLRDPFDLMALGVLPMLWWGLRRQRSDQGARTRRGWWAVGLVAAVLATTATSSSWRESVTDVGFVDGSFYAEVHLRDRGDPRWLRSDDGGLTWIRGEEPAGMPAPIELHDESGWFSCAPDGVCYRARHYKPKPGDQSNGNVVERLEPGAGWRSEAYLSLPGRDLAVNPTNSHQAVVTDGRLLWYRTGSEEWHELDPEPLVSDPKELHELVNSMGSRDAGLAFGLMMGLAGWLLVPTLRGKVISQVVTGILWLAITLQGLLTYPDVRLQLNLTWLAVTVAVMVTVRISWWWKLRSSSGFDPPTGER